MNSVWMMLTYPVLVISMIGVVLDVSSVMSVEDKIM